MKPALLKANWVALPTSEAWLHSMVIGSSLNVCCGTSSVGDVRLDISQHTARTEYGDLHDLTYSHQSFDTVICDPPFSFYSRFKWVQRLADIASKRVILCSPLVNVRLNRNWSRELYYFGGEPKLFLRLWWVFDRINDYTVERMNEP